VTAEGSREALKAGVAAARAAWPALAIEARAFLDYAAARLGEGGPASDHLGDLYLACGCAQGDAAALAALDEKFLAQVGAFVSGIERGSDFADEVRQALREHLLVARDGRGPAIADYSGRGALVRWLRVSAQRIALNLRRGKKPRAEPAEDLRVTSTDPELAWLRKSSQGQFAEALRAALAALTVRERNLLRLHFVEGLSTSDIAPLFHAHRTTIRRQLNECQQALLLGVRERLRAELKLSESQVESLLREGRRSLEISLSTML
jgi:RNA polymerase sigma-70 factor (ECF subfamily)